MTYSGKVRNGVVVFDAPVPLAEGAPVNVEAIEPEKPTGAAEEGPTWGEVLKDVIGKAEGLPSDAARNHDHYLYGTPKR
jgi:hypothetical protein